jgi:hypothetical protein
MIAVKSFSPLTDYFSEEQKIWMQSNSQCGQKDDKSG